jgi:hypothetical protein
MAQEVFSGQKEAALRKEQIEKAMRLQAPQLQLLYQLGIAQAIEQEAGAKIPPLVFLVFEDDHTKLPKVDLERTRKMTMPIFENDLSHEGWMLNPIPQHIDNGLFDTTLRITASRVIDRQFGKSVNNYDAQSLFIEFTQAGHLKVVGDKTTFYGDLATINDEQLAQVQAGIKEAFSNPRIDPSSAWYLE